MGHTRLNERTPLAPHRTRKQQYLAALSTYLKENGNSLGTTVTDYDRVILALTAMGVDARNFNGIDLCAPLADFDAITSQGISGSIYALLALDSHAYAVPELTAGSTGTPTTRAALTGAILAAQLPGGGWNWGFGSDPDPDLTAMALQTLAPYYHTGDAALDAAVDAGLGTLSAIQDDATAGFISVWLDPPAPTSESSAQALTALSALGIAPDDVRFTKTGGTFYDSLTSFLVNTGAGTQAFLNAPGDAAPDGMATEQGLYALAAFARFLSGDARLYDMTDTEIEAYVAEAGGSGNGTENPGSGTPGNGSGTSSGQEQAPAVTEPPATGASGTVSVPATTSAGSLPTTGDAISNLQLVTTALLLMGLATGLYATRRRSAVVAPDKR